MTWHFSRGFEECVYGLENDSAYSVSKPPKSGDSSMGRVQAKTQRTLEPG